MGPSKDKGRVALSEFCSRELSCPKGLSPVRRDYVVYPGLRSPITGV